MSVRRCQGRDCNAPVQLHENGDLRCSNGHTQPDAVGDLLKAMAIAVKDAMLPLRDRIEERFDTVESQLASIEPVIGAIELAHAVPELAAGAQPPSLVDAKTLAAQLGRSRRWVYDHRDELGAVPMSTGARPRLGFDPVHVAEVMASRRNGEEAVEPSPLPRRPRGRSEAIDLLPVKGKAA